MNKNNFFKIKKYKKSVVISFSENNIKADDIYYDLNMLVDDINFDDILIDEPPNPVKMEIFSRIEQTKQLSEIFNKLIS